MKFFLATDETSPQLECKIAVKTDFDNARKNKLQHFLLYQDCQNSYYEVGLLGNSTFKPIPYSTWFKSNTQQKPLKQKTYRTNLLPSVDKENLIDNVNLTESPDLDSKQTINQVFNLHEPLDSFFWNANYLK